MSDTTHRAMTWLQSHDTGTSSKAICAYMLGGAKANKHDYPYDPSDLGRCLRLLDKVPEWKPRIKEMAQFGPVWSALVDRWDEIAASMEAEVGINWEKGRSAPKTYALMRSIRDAVEEDGWVDLGNGARMRVQS